MNRSFLFSSESVTEGHPDKVADAISDRILDAYLEKDPYARVACETLVSTGLVVLAGEVSAQDGVTLNHEEIVRNCIREIGYDSEELGFSADSCRISVHLHTQSQDIAQGVVGGSEIGAGDQGMMFGYANNETPEKMPLAIALSHRLTAELARLRKSVEISWLRPDAKAQVTIAYEGEKAVRIPTVVVSTQHSEKVSQEEIKATLSEKLLKKILPEKLIDENLQTHINPTGKFVIGGPHGDAGLTGRKIIVDTYGGYAPHGGGAFSGKDATKVDRSAAYMARYIAKNVVAAGLADKFQIQLAYAIGVSEPVSVAIETFGSHQVEERLLLKAIKEVFPLKPAQIIETLDLTKANFAQSTCYGHFGRENAGLTWEKTDKVEALKSLF